MRRLWRLLAPAPVSLLLASALVSFDDLVHDPVDGLGSALLLLGLHVLALQLAVSTFVILAIDDLTRGAGWTSRRPAAGRQHGWFEIATSPVALPVALARFYSRPLLPVLLLALGCGLPLSAVVLGVLGEQGSEAHHVLGLQVSRSWAVAVAVAVVGALLLLRAGTARAAVGLVWGLTLAFAWGERSFSDGEYYSYDDVIVPDSNAAEPTAWLVSALALSAVVLVLAALRRLRARARARARASGGDPTRARATASVP